MISVEKAKTIHSILIEKFGGIDGIRNHDLLESSLQRPFQTFDSIELYPEPFQKAAALIQSLLINHPFLDGNKRFGYVAMRLILMKFGYDISANEDEKYTLVIKIAEGKLTVDENSVWIESHLIKTS